MSTFDPHINFGFSTIATAPAPPSSGTTVVLAAGGGALMPATPFNATVWPLGAQPLGPNAEIVRVTNVSVDTLTITRTQESSSARAILVGDQFAATITKKTITDIETPAFDLIPAADDSISLGSTSKRYLKVWGQDADFDGTTTIAGGSATFTTATITTATLTTATVATDIYTTAQWQDYSGTSTIVGWTSFTTKKIFYKQLGALVFVSFNLSGTSNSTTTTFTVPIAANATNPNVDVACATLDNGAPVVGMAQIPAGSSTVGGYTTYLGAAWTASGTKQFVGQFFYSI